MDQPGPRPQLADKRAGILPAPFGPEGIHFKPDQFWVGQFDQPVVSGLTFDHIEFLAVVVVVEFHAVFFGDPGHLIAGFGNLFDLVHRRHNRHRQDDRLGVHFGGVLCDLDHIFAGGSIGVKMDMAPDCGEAEGLELVPDFFGGIFPGRRVNVFDVFVSRGGDVFQRF